MKVFLAFVFARLFSASLFQAGLVPDNLVGIFVQLPLVGLVVWLQIQNQRWLERMLKVQLDSVEGIYQSKDEMLREMHQSKDEMLREMRSEQQVFVTALLEQMGRKQNWMAERIELLTQQVALYGASLAEVSGLADFADRIVEKIQR